MTQKFILILFALILVAVVGGYLLYGSQTQTTPPPAAGQKVAEVTVSGSEYSFSPSTITVAKGSRVKLTFKNTGSISHTFTINELKLDTGYVNPGSTKTVEFDAPADGGILTFQSICTVPGHKESGMVGTLKVE